MTVEAATYARLVGEWFSIEVQSGPSPAGSWFDAYGDDLVRAAFGEGAIDWLSVRAPWGVVLELEFPELADYERFAGLSVVVAALDNAPDPVNGVLVHRGRGGSSGSWRPRRPRPIRGSGAEALPLPEEPALPNDDVSDDLPKPVEIAGSAIPAARSA